MKSILSTKPIKRMTEKISIKRKMLQESIKIMWLEAITKFFCVQKFDNGFGGKFSGK
jgi:hypothetical protein